jgi:glutamyl-tRNA reductase
MSLLALGVNHATAPLEVRSRLAIAPANAPEALRELRALPGVEGAALLSTCNRTELYLSGDEQARKPALDWLHGFQNTGERFDRLFYQHHDEQAVRHVFRVATGLDSMQVGEPQILGQLKDAWDAARASDSMAPPLDHLLQRSFAVAKRVRTETGLGRHPVSMAYAAVRMSRQVFEDLGERLVMLVGAGETAALAAEHLKAAGARRLVIANRSPERARALADRLEAVAIGLERIDQYLPEAELVVCATASQQPLLTVDRLKGALRGKRRRLRVLIDLSVPRNIEAAVAALDDVVLYCVDDLNLVIEEGQRSRRAAAEQAELLIEVQVSDFMRWWRSRDALGPLKFWRAHGDAISAEVLEQALKRLAHGEPADAALRFLAHTLTRKLQHGPTAVLQRAAGRQDQVLLEAAERIFGLPGSQADSRE